MGLPSSRTGRVDRDKTLTFLIEGAGTWSGGDLMAKFIIRNFSTHSYRLNHQKFYINCINFHTSALNVMFKQKIKSYLEGGKCQEICISVFDTRSFIITFFLVILFTPYYAVVM